MDEDMMRYIDPAAYAESAADADCETFGCWED